MTTRRRPLAAPPPPRGRSGRFGLLPPLAMAVTSVKALQLRPDSHLLPQDAREHPPRHGSLEARELATRVHAASRLRPAGHKDAVGGREAEQLALRRPPAAAGAPPKRLRHAHSPSVGAL